MRTLRLSLVGTVTLALLGGMGGAVMAQQTEALEATSEMLFELSVPRWALPDDPTALESGGWTLQAGTDVTGEPQTSQANETMRNRAIMVTGGTFLIEPTTQALLWRAPGTTPEVTPAREAVTLGPGATIYLPAVPASEVDAKRYLRVANPGAEDATGLTFHVHEGSTEDPFGGLPTGLQWRTWSGSLYGLPDVDEWTAADEVLFRLTRYSGDPGTTIDSVDSSAAPATTIYMVESGRVEWIVRGPGGEIARVWRPGATSSVSAADGVEQTLTVVGDGAASFLELTATLVPPTD